jgi:hypothetical protein
MKEFNVTAQVYRLNDPHKQNLLINHIITADSSNDAINQFQNLYSLNIEFKVVKIHSSIET